MSDAESKQASYECREQRLRLLPLLRMDTSKAAPAAVEGCQKALAVALADPVKFDEMLSHPAVVKLFACGAPKVMGGVDLYLQTR